MEEQIHGELLDCENPSQTQGIPEIIPCISVRNRFEMGGESEGQQNSQDDQWLSVRSQSKRRKRNLKTALGMSLTV